MNRIFTGSIEGRGAYTIKPALKRPFLKLKVLVVSAIIVVHVIPAMADAGGDWSGEIPVLDQTIQTGAKNRLEGWEVKRWLGRPDFEVVETETGKALHLKSDSSSTALYSNARYDLRRYPVLKWKWKVTALPDGANAGSFSANDMAIQLFVIIRKWPESINSRVLGYVWDSTMEAEETVAVASPKDLNTKYMVLRSGGRFASQWMAEERNVYDDYKRLFNEEPPGPATISIMIDSDDTRTIAESFISDIYLAREPTK